MNKETEKEFNEQMRNREANAKRWLQNGNLTQKEFNEYMVWGHNLKELL